METRLFTEPFFNDSRCLLIFKKLNGKNLKNIGHVSFGLNGEYLFE